MERATRRFSFHRENVNGDVFKLNITDGDSTYETQVRCWGNTVDAVRAFTACIGDRSAVKSAIADIYSTGYASVGGMNIRVTPLDV